MPRGDRTGPIGSGPMTGRGMGSCEGTTGPGFMSPGPGYGFGRGFGFRRGFGRGFSRFWGHPYPQAMPHSTSHPLPEEQEMEVLNDQAKILEDELNLIKKRQSELIRHKQDTKTTTR